MICTKGKNSYDILLYSYKSLTRVEMQEVRRSRLGGGGEREISIEVR